LHQPHAIRGANNAIYELWKEERSVLKNRRKKGRGRRKVGTNTNTWNSEKTKIRKRAANIKSEYDSSTTREEREISKKKGAGRRIRGGS